VFRRGVEKPPERLLKRIAQIGVGRLSALGRTHTPPTAITVEADPADWNTAHAIIPGRRSRGLANRIKDAVVIHEPPVDFSRA
jgi:hypothetical protein